MSCVRKAGGQNVPRWQTKPRGQRCKVGHSFVFQQGPESRLRSAERNGRVIKGCVPCWTQGVGVAMSGGPDPPLLQSPAPGGRGEGRAVSLSRCPAGLRLSTALNCDSSWSQHLARTVRLELLPPPAAPHQPQNVLQEPCILI